MKNWLTRYQPRYVRSLVYMLQASEYNIRDYLNWYRRTEKFDGVERRKRLVNTPKAVLILVLAWMIVFALFGIAASSLWLSSPINYFIFIVILFLTPYFLAYGIIVPIVLLNIFAQWPIEFAIIQRAKQKLKKHDAVKIAIAGSFGKTTMREILKSVLSENKIVAAPPENYNTPLGISRFIETLKGDEDVLIFELGEYYPGDVLKLCRLIEPEIGIITGVNEAHLEKFKSLDRTVKTIFELSAWLQDRTVYVNGESSLARINSSTSHIIYDRNGIGEWKVADSKTDLTGTIFTLIRRNGQGLKLKTKLLGLHQIGPLATAALIAMRLGLGARQIEQGIARTRPFDHRLEPKTDNSGVTILDDSYNGNPDGVRAIIEFLGSLKGRRRFYVTPGLVEMGPKTGTVHREIGAQLAKAGIDKIVLIKNSVTPFIYDGLKTEKYKGDVIWFDDALVAFEALTHMTVKGDVVLLQNDWPDQYS